jgi:hypothetical protein
LALNFRASDQMDNDWDQLRFGTSYTLGMVQAVAGADPNDYAFGIVTSLWAVRIGLSYHYQVIEYAGERSAEQMTYTEFSFVF